MTIPKLESLMLIVDVFGPLAAAAFALPENSGRRLPDNTIYRSGTKQIVLRPGAIALYLDQQPKDISRGFVFGSDSTSCDVLLANAKNTGISANHLSIRIDWVSRDPIIICLSGNKLRLRVTDSRTDSILSKNARQKLSSGTTASVRVCEDLHMVLCNPTRGNLQAAYDQNLQDYFLKFKNAVPELANISLGDEEVTPLILNNCEGLGGRLYYVIMKIETGDRSYDDMVLVYEAKCKPMPDAVVMTPDVAGDNIEQPRYSSYDNGHEDTEGWLGSEGKGGESGEVYIVKHFREKKKNESTLPDHFPDLCRLNHLNLEGLVDLISEPSAFMTITDPFSHTTLHVLHQEEPLGTEEAAFVLGQVFAALQYLHDQSWTHGNVDPRSIHVRSRKELWIQLTDTGLSDYVDLGKPKGYHAIYASQHILRKADQFATDIWSAGVVALELLLPNGLPHRNFDTRQTHWLQKLERLAVSMDRKSGNDATALVKSTLKVHYKERPTAREVLNNSWIIRNRGEDIIIKLGFNLSTPQGSRQTSVGPSSPFSRQDSANSATSPVDSDTVPESHHASVGSPRSSNTQGSFTPLQSAKYQENGPGPRHTSGVVSSKRPYCGDDGVDFDSDLWTSSSRSNHFTANALVQNSRVPTPYDSLDDTDLTGRRGTLRSQTRDDGEHSPLIDWATGTFGPISGRREARIEESGDETETDDRREPVTRKPRKGATASPVEKDSRSR